MSAKPLLSLLAITALGASLATAGIFDREIARDEWIDFFPTYATFDEEKREWHCRVFGCVYEIGIRAGVGELIAHGVISHDDGDEDDEKSRGDLRDELVRRFFVDTESFKAVHLEIFDVQLSPPHTDENGLFEGLMVVPETSIVLPEVPAPGDMQMVNVRARLPKKDRREFVGNIYLIPPRGVSVISDIDDTIRDTGTGDVGKVLQSTLVGEFKPIAGMETVYQGWAARPDVRFHYVSNGPWALANAIVEFIASRKFPAGSLHLQTYRIGIPQLYHRVSRGKQEAIAQILADFPQRRFVLVGDANEEDPEVYGEIARAFPEQVAKILIRKSDKKRSRPERLAEAFKGLPEERWQLYADPNEIADVLKTLESSSESSPADPPELELMTPTDAISAVSAP